ncbi:MAG: tRNA lysidine(34) synthetase TilS [Dehalococcoidia bacterium]|nr:tRNA lysidine(34) synthetase TilS [Dehalococcoidia bacterium]
MVAMIDGVPQRIAKCFHDHNLSGSTLVVAVSGGADSVCLLHILSVLKDDLSLKLCVAHLDHMLRGCESHADAEYVENLARRMRITAEIGQTDVHALRRERKMTIEEAARFARYRFLARAAIKYDTDLVVTGHTQDDQVETILMHIIRGSGLRGLVGLQTITPRIIDDHHLRIMRPMLDITKAETQDYCRCHNLSPRLDSSNMDTIPMRNRIRLKLLPLLETINPNINDAILRLSAVAGNEKVCLDEQALELAKQVMTRKGDVITLDTEPLIGISPALTRHMLRCCLEQLPEGLQDIESVHIEDMLLLLSKPAGRQLNLPRGLIFLKGYGCCYLGREMDLPCPFHPLGEMCQLLIPGITSFSGWSVEASFVRTMDKNASPWVAYMDMDAVGTELWVKSWQNGDYFQPLGQDGIKKLGEFMIDAHIPRMWRKKIPVVASTAGIVWLMGYRLDERVKVTAQSRRILRLKFQRESG